MSNDERFDESLLVISSEEDESDWASSFGYDQSRGDPGIRSGSTSVLRLETILRQSNQRNRSPEGPAGKRKYGGEPEDGASGLISKPVDDQDDTTNQAAPRKNAEPKRQRRESVLSGHDQVDEYLTSGLEVLAPEEKLSSMTQPSAIKELRIVKKHAQKDPEEEVEMDLDLYPCGSDKIEIGSNLEEDFLKSQAIFLGWFTYQHLFRSENSPTEEEEAYYIPWHPGDPEEQLVEPASEVLRPDFGEHGLLEPFSLGMEAGDVLCYGIVWAQPILKHSDIGSDFMLIKSRTDS